MIENMIEKNKHVGRILPFNIIMVILYGSSQPPIPHSSIYVATPTKIVGSRPHLGKSAPPPPSPHPQTNQSWLYGPDSLYSVLASNSVNIALKQHAQSVCICDWILIQPRLSKYRGIIPRPPPPPPPSRGLSVHMKRGGVIRYKPFKKRGLFDNTNPLKIKTVRGRTIKNSRGGGGGRVGSFWKNKTSPTSEGKKLAPPNSG